MNFAQIAAIATCAIATICMVLMAADCFRTRGFVPGMIISVLAGFVLFLGYRALGL